MDVNGTRFHLLKGAEDWRACRDSAGGRWENLSLDEAHGSVSLKPLLLLFINGKGRAPLDLAARRAAAVDEYGNWFWVGHDRRTIWWRASGSERSRLFWSQDAAARPAEPGGFAPSQNAEAAPAVLSGLAVTQHHYLVVGAVSGEEEGKERKGSLCVFDLHGGGGPVRLTFPAGVPFEPFDLAAAPGGGVWVLDRANSAYWGLDRQFRVVSEEALMAEVEPEDRWTFRPAGGAEVVRPARRFPRGFPLTKLAGGAETPILDAVAVEALPDGGVLVLESPAYANPAAHAPDAAPVSIVHRFRFGARLASTELRDDEQETAASARREGETVAVAAYDFAYAPAEGRLYAAEGEGNQAVAFDLKLDGGGLSLKAGHEFLPLHFFGSRAIVARGGEVFYDVVGGDPSRDRAVRWLRVREVEEPHYERSGSLTTPPLDGKERGCVWHRLFLDACVPTEANVEVWTRAHDDRALLESMPFVREPAPYLRGAGAELPFFKAFAGRESLPEGTGTWELLFQEARGRFLQIRLALAGNGRVSPRLHAMRAYYPRFSYPRQYLPAAFLEDEDSRSFLERFLANQEGFFSEIEGKVSEVSALFDARSAPAETLDWLAGWLGLVLDPLWARLQQRRPEGAGADRRRLFIRFARRLYDTRGTTRGLLFALNLLLDPCLETTAGKLKSAAVRPGDFPALLAELDSFGLPRPRPSTSERDYEDTLYEYVLSPRRPSKVRVVERYRTRGGRSAVEGDPTGLVASRADADAAAHAFSVLVPEALSAEEEAMVARVVELEKPAHTRFDVRRYWDYFRVGETRLGVDTTLGESARHQAVVLGGGHLAEGYLYPSHPWDVRGRVVADRDRAGNLPTL